MKIDLKYTARHNWHLIITNKFGDEGTFSYKTKPTKRQVRQAKKLNSMHDDVVSSWPPPVTDKTPDWI